MALSHGRIAAPAALLAALAVGACTNDERPGARLTVLGTVAETVQRAAGRAPEASRITLGDAELRAFPRPLLVVETPGRNAEAGVTVQVTNGNAVTWATEDNITLTLRDGVLIQTRGMGDDLMSAAIPDVRRVRGSAVRTHYTIAGDETTRRHRYICRIADRGPQRVVVTGVAYAARLITESCEGAEGGGFRNDYWIEADGLIRKSRQFATDGIGHLVISDVQG